MRSATYLEMSDDENYLEVAIAHERIFDCTSSDHYAHVFVSKQLLLNLGYSKQQEADTFPDSVLPRRKNNQ